jgi:hypothetical protein
MCVGIYDKDQLDNFDGELLVFWMNVFLEREESVNFWNIFTFSH